MVSRPALTKRSSMGHPPATAWSRPGVRENRSPRGPLAQGAGFQGIERELKFPGDAIPTRSSRSRERIVALSALWKSKRSRQMTAVGRQRASRHLQFATAIRVSLKNPRNSRPHASAVAASFPRVQSSVYSSSAGQALDEDLRQAGNEVTHGGETRNDVQISELNVYFTVAVGSGRLSIWSSGGRGQNRTSDTRIFRPL